MMDRQALRQMAQISPNLERRRLMAIPAIVYKRQGLLAG